MAVVPGWLLHVCSADGGSTCDNTPKGTQENARCRERLTIDTCPGRLTFKQTLLKTVAKAYWIAAYRSVRDQEALAAYAKLAGPALQAAGGRFLARGLPARVYEGGLDQRIVLIVFDSVAQAIAAHDSPGYQQALRALGNAVDRDLRIVEGVE